VNRLAFDVGLYCGFPDLGSYRVYMEHSAHMAWCKFVLRGWKLVGSRSGDTHAEFVDYILTPQTNRLARDRERDSTPDCEVVWDGEQVFDFGELEHLNIQTSVSPDRDAAHMNRPKSSSKSAGA